MYIRGTFIYIRNINQSSLQISHRKVHMLSHHKFEQLHLISRTNLIMFSSVLRTSLRSGHRVISCRSAPSSMMVTAEKAASCKVASRYVTGAPFAVDGPDGRHDLQDIEESSLWAKQVIDLASVTEDTKAINEVHDAVFGNRPFAVDAPDGEHDLEDVEEHLMAVEEIIQTAFIYENPYEIKEQQHLREESRKEAVKAALHDV